MDTQCNIKRIIKIKKIKNQMSKTIKKKKKKISALKITIEQNNTYRH